MLVEASDGHRPAVASIALGSGLRLDLLEPPRHWTYIGPILGKNKSNFGTGRSSQVTTQLFYNCKKVNCLAFVPLGTHQGFAAVNAANSRTCQGIAFNNLGKCTWKTLDKEKFFWPLPQPTLRPKFSKLVCIYYETNYGQHSSTLKSALLGQLGQAKIDTYGVSAKSS